MDTDSRAECCPPFDPEPWRDRDLSWAGRRFVRDRVRTLFHVPLNFGAVMARNLRAIEAAGAGTPGRLVLADACSPWRTEVYLETAGDVPGAETVTLSGTFLSRVFEGPYRRLPDWMRDMTAFVRERGKTLQKLYVYYTTCPRCAKKHGKNYVVLLARVADPGD